MTITPLELQDEVLLRRPEARAFKVEDLMNELRQGRVRVPEFQRAVKWERKNAHQLLDSIYRGYPVGTLLLWENDAPTAEVAFGSVKLSALGRKDAYWIVDGQQRIMSLARTLMAPSADEDEFAAYFDLDEMRFVFPPRPISLAEDPSRWFPLTEALDSERLLAWLFEHASDNKPRREKATQLGKRIREYEIPVYIVRTDNEQVLRDVFNRANSTGVAMDEHEVFEALHGSRSNSAPSSIRQINKILSDLEFGRIDEKNLYRLLRVLRGEDVSDRGGKGPLRLSATEAETAYRQTTEAASAAILFLRREAGIPHYELLPYKQPFIALGKFFHLHPNPTARSRELLVRWLWRGALNGIHRGDTVSTRADLDRIMPDDESGSVQRLLEVASQSPTKFVEVGNPFKFSNAASKLLTLALLELMPLEMLTGKPVRTAALLSQAQDGSALPLPQILLNSPGNTEGFQRSAANRLVQKAHPGTRKTLLHVSDQGILTSHGISAEAHEALRQGDEATFLRLRATAIRTHASSFFDSKARWQETDRPPLAALLINDSEA